MAAERLHRLLTKRVFGKLPLAGAQPGLFFHQLGIGGLKLQGIAIRIRQSLRFPSAKDRKEAAQTKA
jgi:hypothetical protein